MHPIFIAIDTTSLPQAKKWGELAATHDCGIKLGLEFYIRFGAMGCQEILSHCEEKVGKRPLFFLDLKLHDIPNTVGKSVASALPLQPDFLTIHAFGGKAMMQAAVEISHNTSTNIVAVSVLTSMNDDDLSQCGIADNSENQVMRLAGLALDSGVRHLVCSPWEIKRLKASYQDDISLITPGIRPNHDEKDDQQRIMSPKMAFDSGTDYIVIGRPVTKASDSQQALKNLISLLT